MSQKTNLVRCLRCKRTLIREEFESHSCMVPHKGVRSAEITQWWESKNEFGEPLLMAIGVDGYVYRLTQVNPARKAGFEEIQPSTETLQEKSRDDIHREGDSPRTPKR